MPESFAAQFSLSHACWLLGYPLARWVGVAWGLDAAFVALALLALTGGVLAWRAWPAPDQEIVAKIHPDLALIIRIWAMPKMARTSIHITSTDCTRPGRDRDEHCTVGRRPFRGETCDG